MERQTFIAAIVSSLEEQQDIEKQLASAAVDDLRCDASTKVTKFMC